MEVVESLRLSEFGMQVDGPRTGQEPEGVLAVNHLRLRGFAFQAWKDAHAK